MALSVSIFASENSIEPDHLVSDETSCSGTTMLFIHMMHENIFLMKFAPFG